MLKFGHLGVLLVPLALAACGGGGGGRAIALRPGSGGNYQAPGPARDPWGPYVREAAARFAVPQTWVRAVIRQESGGREYLHGEPITSGAGAMGLMQLMPATYAELAARYGLGDDPYDPHDNIMAGTAYISELAARYGSPGFLAAYDAGPRRLDDYLAGRASLPNETVAYLDQVAPRLVGTGAMSGPLAAFARGAPVPPPSQAPVEVAEAEPPTAPGSRLWGGVPMAPAPAPPPRPGGFGLIGSAYADTRPMDPRDARWGVQVGAFTDPAQARQVANSARQVASAQLAAAHTVVGAVTHADGKVFYRARVIGVTQPAADSACGLLSARQWPCLAVPPGG